MRTINKLFYSWDSLTIYDGASNTSPMMGKYCGDSIPPSHTSSNNEVLIHFYSDGMNMEAEAGFKMEYNSRGKQITQFKTTLNII
jgi:cubilin